MTTRSKNIVFDIIGTCVSYDAFVNAIESTLGPRLRVHGIKPLVLANFWIEAGEREYTYLSMTGRYQPLEKVYRSIFPRMLGMSGISSPTNFCTDEEIERLMQGYRSLELRDDTKAAFTLLRKAGFTVRGLTAGSYDSVAGFFTKADLDFPREHLVSCDAAGVGKPELGAYLPTFEALKGSDELWFAAAHMWDVSTAKKLGYVESRLVFPLVF